MKARRSRSGQRLGRFPGGPDQDGEHGGVAEFGGDRTKCHLVTGGQTLVEPVEQAGVDVDVVEVLVHAVQELGQAEPKRQAEIHQGAGGDECEAPPERPAEQRQQQQSEALGQGRRDQRQGRAPLRPGLPGQHKRQQQKEHADHVLMARQGNFRDGQRRPGVPDQQRRRASQGAGAVATEQRHDADIEEQVQQLEADQVVRRTVNFRGAKMPCETGI